jgi:hypothetical protein
MGGINSKCSIDYAVIKLKQSNQSIYYYERINYGRTNKSNSC